MRGQFGLRDDVGADALAHRNSVDPQPFPSAVVGLHQGADGVAPGGGVGDPRRGADAALEAVADHAGAAADVALGHGPVGRGGQGGLDVVGLHMEAVDVAEQPVVGLPHHRQRPVDALTAGGHLGGDQRVADDAGAVGVGDPDRGGQFAGFLDPLQAGHLAAAVEAMGAGEDGLGPDVVVRDDDGDPGVDVRWAGVVESGVPDAHPRYVGDGVVRPRRVFPDDDAEIPGPHAVLPECFFP